MEEKMYSLVFGPDLELSPAAFTAAWNETNEARSLGQAQLFPPKSAQYDLTIVAGTLVVIATNVASSALYDALKLVIQRLRASAHTQSNPSAHRHLHIKKRKQPDGSSLLIIDLDEK
jgi:hypothetical protein